MASSCHRSASRHTLCFHQLLLLFVLLSFDLLRELSAYQLCKNLESPKALNATLQFCSAPAYAQKGCCSAARDAELSAIFQGYKIPPGLCASLIQNITCAECDAWAADLYGASVYSAPRAVPFLCSSATPAPGDFSTASCGQVWEACKNISIQYLPFGPSNQTTPTTLGERYMDAESFCLETAPSSSSAPCFRGGPYRPPAPATFTAPRGVCYERIAEGMYIDMAPHPIGNRTFLLKQSGEIYLAPIPARGQAIDEAALPVFLNLADRVYFAGELGLLGFALHPGFASNGRFFVSYACSAAAHADCAAARCACDAASGCASSEAMFPASANGACNYTSVVAEYSALDANGTLTDSANPTEVRRIWTMGHPFSNHLGGDLHFGPVDGFLYYTMGDGGRGGDPYNFAQSLLTPLGKILRIDVDDKTGANVTSPEPWGTYTIPGDNPFATGGGLPEIWAYGLRNPWRCSFDYARPWYFICGDVGQNKVEEVDLIVKGGNYGWRILEGTEPYKLPNNNSDVTQLNLIPPIVEYNRSESKDKGSVIGGFVYRGTADPCLYGLYIFNDWFGAGWVANESPPNSGIFTKANIATACTNSSSPGCPKKDPSWGGAVAGVWAYAEDNDRNLYAFGSGGLLRVVSPSLCDWPTCQEGALVLAPPMPSPPSPSVPAPSPLPPSPSDGIPKLTARKGATILLLVAVGMTVNWYLGPQLAATVLCILALRFSPQLLGMAQ